MNPGEISQSIIEAETARFMTRVYTWMVAGLALTGAIAWRIGQDEILAATIVGNKLLFWGLVIAQLGAVIVLAALIERVNSTVAALIYFAYAALTGATLSSIFLTYTTESIGQVFGLAAFSFAGLSAFGFVTKRDLDPIGSFCMMGLFGMVGYGLISLFFPSMMGSRASFVYSVVGVIVFAGLTAYDTQKIKSMNIIGNESTDEDRKEAIFGALTLYLDFINLFLKLLQLFGKRK
jgi:FtsH-binding integral membrane protein